VGELVDEVMFPEHRREVIYRVPADKALITFTDINHPEPGEPERSIEKWYIDRFMAAGIAVTMVKVKYL
jgi:hypothetical protein